MSRRYIANFMSVFTCSNIGIFTFYRRNQLCIKFSRNLIIRVRKTYVRPCSCLNSRIARSYDSTIGLVYHSNPTVALRKLVTNRSRGIC